MEGQKRRWRSAIEAAETGAKRSPQQTSAALAGLMVELREARRAHPEDPELGALEARARFAEATIHTHARRFRIAEMAFRTLLEGYELAEQPLRVADCLDALAVVAARQDDPKASLGLLERSFHLRSRHDAPADMLARTVMNIGITQAKLGEVESALETLRFAEELYGGRSVSGLAVIETNRALLHRATGRADACRDCLDHAIALLDGVGPSPQHINALLERATEDIQRGTLPEAEAWIARAEPMVEAIGVPFMEVEFRLVRARLRLARGLGESAEADLAVAMQSASPEQRCRLLAARVEVAESAGDWAGANRCLRSLHAEELALLEDQYAARLATARTDLTTRIDQEQRRWLRDELVRAQADAQALTSRLEDQTALLADAVHDINNPLSVVLILGEMATRTPESMQASAESIVAAARHMRNLVTDLLHAAHPTGAALPLRVGALPVRTLLQGAHDRYEPLAAAKGQTLVLALPPQDGWVDGDENGIARVLDNLLSNAIKYSPPGGAIELRQLWQGDQAIIEVLDTGPGLSPADLERVFLQPQRLSATPTAGEDSHGIGLVSVRRLVAGMGGHVSAENRLRGGARFSVTLNRAVDLMGSGPAG